MKSTESRLTALEKRQVGQNQIYYVFVEPPPGAVIDNRTVFQKLEDVPADYFKQSDPISVYKGLDPGRI